MARTTTKKPESTSPWAKLDKILGETPKFGPVPYWLSCGLDLVDWSVSENGFPSGRVIEVFGDAGGGKTSLALGLARSAQLQGGMVIFLDAEQGLDFGLPRMLGVKTSDQDTDYWIYRSTRYVEHTINAIEYLCQVRASSDAPTVVIWDSIAGGVPRRNSMEERTIDESARVGERASLLTRFFENGTLHTIRNRPIWLVMLNQIRAAIGARHPGTIKTPAGEAMKFFASVRVHVDPAESITDSGKRMIGRMVTTKVHKNKVSAQQFRKAEFPLFFGYGPDNEMALINYLIGEGVLKQSGAYVYFDGKGYYKNQLRDFLKENREALAAVREAAKQTYFGVTE